MPLAPPLLRGNDEGVYVPTELPSFIAQSPLLRKYSLVIDKRNMVIICCRCGQAVRASTLQAHFKDRDGHEQDVGELSFENLLKHHPYDIQDQDRPIKPDQLPSHPVPYLQIKKGFTCVAPHGSEPCYRTLSQRRKIVEHQKEWHEGQSGYTIRETLMQSFFAANLARYFPIHQLTDVEPGFADYWRTYVDVADADAEAPPDPPQPRNEREQEPFFRKHAWYQVFEPYDKRKLLELHSGQPRAGVEWEAELSSLIHQYYAALHDNIPSLHPAVAKVLAQKDE